jgi:hypothetical protein
VRRTLILAVAAAIGAVAVAGPADAHGRRGRVHFGVVIGGPLWWHAWPHYPRYYDERVIVERQGPTVYVEKDADGGERDADQYWYYCPDSATYYPYVKQCASPWHRIEPQPPQ